MSYKAAVQMKPILVHIIMSTNQTLASGDTLAVDTVTGSTGHGVTISSGVVTLPAGHQWAIQAQVRPTSLVNANLNWYVNNSASTTFQNTGISLLNSTSNTSNLMSFIALNSTSSSIDFELRADAAVTIDSNFTCMILMGYPSA
jgi:hypothetical protein